MRKITPTIILMTLYMCVTEKSLIKKRLETGVFVAFKMSFVKQSGMYRNSSVFFFKLVHTSIHFFSTLIEWISFIVNFMQVP